MKPFTGLFSFFWVFFERMISLCTTKAQGTAGTAEIGYQPGLYIPPAKYSLVPEIHRVSAGDLITVHREFSTLFGGLVFQVESLLEETLHPVIRVQDIKDAPSYLIALPAWAYIKVAGDGSSPINTDAKHIVKVCEGSNLPSGLYCFFPLKYRESPLFSPSSLTTGGFALRIEDCTADESNPVFLKGGDYKVVRSPEEPLEQYLVNRLPKTSPHWKSDSVSTRFLPD